MNQDLLIRHCEIRRSFHASSLTKLEDPPVYIEKIRRSSHIHRKKIRRSYVIYKLKKI